MKNFDFGRCALGICIVAVMLAGCGGSQPPIGGPSKISQNAAASAPNASSSGALLYAVSAANYVYVFPYKRNRLIQTLAITSPTGACSDSNGNVFITSLGSGTEGQYTGIIYEYAHGGASPIATLYETSGSPYGCSVDATTGNLAVANDSNVAVFVGAQGTAKYYSVKGLSAIKSCVYDTTSDLYAIGQLTSNEARVAVLLEGGHGFQDVTDSGGPLDVAGANPSVHYSKPYLVLLAFPTYNADIMLDRGYRMAGKVAQDAWGAFKSVKYDHHEQAFQPSWPWYQGNTIVAPVLPQSAWIGIWPGIKKNASRIVKTHEGQLIALTVSNAPSR